jgi:molybdopterin-guanine dinucleotide biosynthesis protein A
MQKEKIRKMKPDTSSIILAGGKSARMEQDKVLITIGSESLLQRTINAIHPLSRDILIVTSKYQSFSIPSCKKNLNIISDIFPDKGVLGGLYTGLVASKSLYNLVVAIDMPFLKQNLLLHQLQIASEYEAVIPRLGKGVEPLHAVYSKDCACCLKLLLDKGQLKISDAFPLLRVRYLETPEIERFDPRHLSFFNVNTVTDLEKAREMETVEKWRSEQIRSNSLPLHRSCSTSSYGRTRRERGISSRDTLIPGY